MSGAYVGDPSGGYLGDPSGGYVADPGGVVPQGPPFPPSGPVSVTRVLPSYLYQQYTDDDALQTFVAAYNVMAQQWLDNINALNLPVWSNLSGMLLDWVGAGLYGIPRPTLSYVQTTFVAGYGVAPYGFLPYAMPFGTAHVSVLPVNDDIYKRVITWHRYKGDGYQYSARWLKQRVHRFLNGSNGVLTVNDNTYDVSVSYAGAVVTITVANTPIGTILKFAIADGILALPFQYSFSVTLV